MPYWSSVLDRSDIGISTGAYAGLPLASALLRIAELAASAEVCSWGYHSLLELENRQAIASMGLPFSVHGPFTHEGLGSRFRSKRRAAVDLHRRHMAVAAELGATCYVLHPDLQRRQKPRRPSVALALQRSFEEFRGLGDEIGLRILVENMMYTQRSHFSAPGDLDLQGLDVTLDVGHAAMTGTLNEWLTDPKATIRHVHLHDNHGPGFGDLHQALGTGVIDVAPALAATRAAGATIVLEHVSDRAVLASLAYLRAQGHLPGDDEEAR